MKKCQKIFRRNSSCPAWRSSLEIKPSSAFTLLEVLLAITITGFVLAAASAMIVSVSNIWASRQESNFFEDHVDGVAEFVQSCFTKAGTEIALSNTDSNSPSESGEPGQETENNEAIPETPTVVRPGTATNRNQSQENSTGSSLLRRTEEPIGWAQPPGFAGYQDPLINFKLRDDPPLLINIDNAPAMGIDAFLYFDRDEGLSLLWYSILQEEVENENDLRRTLISPFVASIRYIYWDERFERWEEDEVPKEGEEDEFLLPRFIKLIFEYEEITKERTISIPVPSRSAILF
jgi:hypothetical protein